jgi:hypothetical protein
MKLRAGPAGTAGPQGPSWSSGGTGSERDVWLDHVGHRPHDAALHLLDGGLRRRLLPCRVSSRTVAISGSWTGLTIDSVVTFTDKVGNGWSVIAVNWSELFTANLQATAQCAS